MPFSSCFFKFSFDLQTYFFTCNVSSWKHRKRKRHTHKKIILKNWGPLIFSVFLISLSLANILTCRLKVFVPGNILHLYRIMKVDCFCFLSMQRDCIFIYCFFLCLYMYIYSVSPQKVQFTNFEIAQQYLKYMWNKCTSTGCFDTLAPPPQLGCRTKNPNTLWETRTIFCYRFLRVSLFVNFYYIYSQF